MKEEPLLFKENRSYAMQYVKTVSEHIQHNADSPIARAFEEWVRNINGFTKTQKDILKENDIEHLVFNFLCNNYIFYLLAAGRYDLLADYLDQDNPDKAVYFDREQGFASVKQHMAQFAVFNALAISEKPLPQSLETFLNPEVIEVQKLQLDLWISLCQRLEEVDRTYYARRREIHIEALDALTPILAEMLHDKVLQASVGSEALNEIFERHQNCLEVAKGSPRENKMSDKLVSQLYEENEAGIFALRGKDPEAMRRHCVSAEKELNIGYEKLEKFKSEHEASRTMLSSQIG